MHQWYRHELTIPQKEVERRRRENINDGINDLVRLLPGGLSDKVGKGLLLRRAAEHLAVLTERSNTMSEELTQLRADKHDLNVSPDTSVLFVLILTDIISPPIRPLTPPYFPHLWSDPLGSTACSTSTRTAFDESTRHILLTLRHA